MPMRSLLALSLAMTFMACGPAGPATIEFVEITPTHPRIGDIVTVRFKLTDSRGTPLGGTNVEFRLKTDQPGVKLSPVTALSQRGSGIAETQVVSSARVASIIVVATSGDKTVQSPAITFAGSTPSARQFTFQCGTVAGDASGGRHALGAFDVSRNLIAGVKLECSAHVGDRNGDGVPNALVSFLTEAGTIGPTETSVSNVIGNATILYKTSEPLPLDVPPGSFTWTPQKGADHISTYIAPLWMHPYDWVRNPVVFPRPAIATGEEPRRNDFRRKLDGSVIVMNPRDNLVTMISITAGEEGFDDNNNNGVFDDGDTFDLDRDDLPEPFVDSNDNGTWDPGERFIDANGSGDWTAENGEWDADTLIWTQERILWTGIPGDHDKADVISAVNAPGGLDMKCPGTGPNCSQASPVEVEMLLSDPWYNSIAQNGDSDGCGLVDDDKTLVRSVPRAFNEGSRYTYPAATLIHLTIADSRDPNSPANEQVPRRVPPAEFIQQIICRFTGSPVEGQETVLSIGTLKGTIE